eukprot:SAG31_NODE_39374_length_288_cov_2.195767_1_plen_56_part_01
MLSTTTFTECGTVVWAYYDRPLRHFGGVLTVAHRPCFVLFCFVLFCFVLFCFVLFC